MNDTNDRARFEAEKQLYTSQGDLTYLLARFGDHIADREGYEEHRGMDAVWFYVVTRYHWQPAQVRAMHPDDLRWLLSEEMRGWTAPAAARV